MRVYEISSDDKVKKWYQDRLAHALDIDSMDANQTWIWKWNTLFEEKISIKNGKLILKFKSEKDLTMFLLRET